MLRTEVLVVGGGPVGLVASALLSRLGVPHLVVERRARAQDAPAAHVLRPRPMQVLALLGVDDEIRRTAPPLPLHYVTWCATLGGREVGRIDVRGESGEEPWTNCPQNVLEPILRRNAARHPEAELWFGAECLQVIPDADRVSARVRRDGGAEEDVEARWAIAADGASSRTREALGIPMVGQGALGRFYMVHFEADLWPWIQARPGPLFWILNPEAPGTLIVHDPKRSHVWMTPVRGEEDALPALLERSLGVPAPKRILSVRPWSPHVQVAERYREGRVLLAGDAAHRFPPTGGLGLNTGILDVHSLVWKLAKVLAGAAPESLLDRYPAECRPVARANAEASFGNLLRLGEISRAIGDCADLASLERRLASMTAAERETLDRAIGAQRSHFVSEGELPPEGDGIEAPYTGP